MIGSRTVAATRRSVRWTAVAALGVAAALVNPGPASAAPADISGGSLTWGFKASFRGYVSTGNGTPPIAVSNGASINANGTFTFPSTGGSYDPATGATTARHGGTVVFSYPAHMFTITLANPTVELSSGMAALKADVDLATTGAEPVSVRQAEIAVLDTAGATPDSSGATVSWANLPATLTSVGASAFNGFYAAGDALDPVSFSLTTGGGGTPTGPAVTVAPSSAVDPAGTTITIDGTGFDPDANNGAGIYVSFGPKVDEHWINAGVLQTTKWVNKTNEPTEARDTLQADGSFRTTLAISARYTDRNGNAVDCTTVQCYVITFAARGSADRSQDTFTPVTFQGTAPGGVGSAEQEITTTVQGGPLTLTVAGSSVALPLVANGEITSGALPQATVADLRGTNAGWSLVGQVENFTSVGGGVIAADNLGWVPSASFVTDPLVGSSGVVTPGATANPGTGLGSARALCTSAAGASAGQFACGAQLNLGVPASAPAGDYTATLTLTLS
ncbi:HtaA domain-containing protein [Micromonospora sp. NPDC003197]